MSEATTAELAHIEEAIRQLAVPIDTLKSASKNARKHSQRNIEAVKNSLKGFRQQTPVVYDDKGEVIKGNATLEAAKLLGWTHIAAVKTTLSDMQAVAYGIADNRTGDAEVGSQWDEDSLAELLGMLDNDLQMDAGFEDFEVQEITLDLEDYSRDFSDDLDDFENAPPPAATPSTPPASGEAPKTPSGAPSPSAPSAPAGGDEGFDDFEDEEDFEGGDGTTVRPPAASQEGADTEEATPSGQPPKDGCWFYIEFYGNKEEFLRIQQLLQNAGGMRTEHELEPEFFKQLILKVAKQ